MQRCDDHGVTGLGAGFPLTLTDRFNSMDRRGASDGEEGQAPAWWATPDCCSKPWGLSSPPAPRLLFLHEQKFPPQVVSMTSDNAHSWVLRASVPSVRGQG